MKKTRLIPLLTVLLALLMTSASAASLMTDWNGQVPVASVKDSTGAVVTALTDNSKTTVWTRTASGYGADLTFNLYSASVGEIWIRSGHCYSQNYYNYYDRPDVVAVTLWYPANRYTSTSVTYRYRMSDAFRPSTTSTGWRDGYQRLLLPQEVDGVTRIELTIESSIQGYNKTGATITDVIIMQGQHATATPKAYATATPRRYVEYITPSPTPYINWGTPVPTERPVVIITPRVTATPPLVELLTPVPTNTPYIDSGSGLPTVDYPTEGFVAELLKTAATRSGPSNDYDEPGSFFSKGDDVNVISKAWDAENGLWWYQIEFNYKGEWMRAYTPETRISIDPAIVPTENMEADSREVLYDQRVYFGPGEEYRMYKVSMLYQGSKADVYAVEDDWAQIHYHDYAIGEDRRGWVPVECLSTWPFTW